MYILKWLVNLYKIICNSFQSNLCSYIASLLVFLHIDIRDSIRNCMYSLISLGGQKTSHSVTFQAVFIWEREGSFSWQQLQSFSPCQGWGHHVDKAMEHHRFDRSTFSPDPNHFAYSKFLLSLTLMCHCKRNIFRPYTMRQMHDIRNSSPSLFIMYFHLKVVKLMYQMIQKF